MTERAVVLIGQYDDELRVRASLTQTVVVTQAVVVSQTIGIT